jgi:tRNA-Thr(GGU) m(6)t(6)A37 methyltransferase TsaA
MAKLAHSSAIVPIAHIRSDFKEKFGIPRQSGLVDALEAEIVLDPDYRTADALRGIEGFSHLWLIWQFSGALRSEWSPTVRPPRLGGNTRVGVFASRSPFRPNSLGLSSVRLTGIDWDTPEGPVLHIAGADLLDGTPIFDIKPYLAYVDSHPDAVDGFAAAVRRHTLQVECAPELLDAFPAEKRAALFGVLSQDPRPAYQEDAERVYGMDFAGYNIRFVVSGDVLTVRQIAPAAPKSAR